MEWIRGSTIGRGSTATVSLATAVPSGEVFAVKSTDLSHSRFLQREHKLLSQLSCPHVVKYIGFDVSYENNKPMYNLCMEYVPGGTLYNAIQRHGGDHLDEPVIRSYTRQILQGLEYLHENGLVHCDIKSHNILIGKDGAKIADFGFAKMVGKVSGNGDSDSLAFSGTPVFMAPEVARGEEQGFEADVWAVGCTVIEMATGSTPWPEMNDPVSALYRIGFSGDLPEIPRWISEKGKDFLSKCFRRDPRERWTAKELLEHPFLEEISMESHNSLELKEFVTSSPSSVLDQGFWDSMEVLESHWNPIHEETFSNSAEERIKKLIGGTLSLSSVSCVPNWTWDEDWITVRSNELVENEKFPEEIDVFLLDEISVSSAVEMDSRILAEVPESSMFDEDFLFQHFTISTSVTIRRDFVIRNLSFEAVHNENSCFLPSLFFNFNHKSIQYNPYYVCANIFPLISYALIFPTKAAHLAQV